MTYNGLGLITITLRCLLKFLVVVLYNIESMKSINKGRIRTLLLKLGVVKAGTTGTFKLYINYFAICFIKALIRTLNLVLSC